MAKAPKNSGKAWSPDNVKQLRDLAKGNTPTRVDRTEDRPVGRKHPVEGCIREDQFEAAESASIWEQEKVVLRRKI